MGTVQDAKRKVGEAIASVRAGTEKLASRRLSLAGLKNLQVSSPAFSDGSPLPRRFTADGENQPPPLEWAGLPAETRSVAIVCEDPDAPLPEPFVHWIVYGIPETARSLGANASELKQGQNSRLKTGFTGADPPAGHGLHHYHFQVFALDARLELEAGEGRDAVFRAMDTHVLAWGETVAVYERKP